MGVRRVAGKKRRGKIIYFVIGVKIQRKKSEAIRSQKSKSFLPWLLQNFDVENLNLKMAKSPTKDPKKKGHPFFFWMFVTVVSISLLSFAVGGMLIGSTYEYALIEPIQ